ncbi:hypothetical protein J2R98_001058 [Alkalibacillus filiformis]|uniref:Uncharacterized protein n=1 Tax=Alkalibacillus filiformis TaxID=200990 RepID=A0ABU0DS45_9BACI|nr:hypothetical protein [Alkalibacillus filiformis]
MFIKGLFQLTTKKLSHSIEFLYINMYYYKLSKDELLKV